MKKTLPLALLFCGFLSTPSFALESLSDTQLSKSTGQDGITVKISGDGVTGLDHLRVIDGDGYQSGTINQSNQAGLSLDFHSPVRACVTTASATCTLSTDPLVLEIDTDAGNTGAFVNVRITGSAQAFYVPISSISLVGGTNTKGSWSTEKAIIELKDDAGNPGGIAINMDNALSANLQLGAQPQGRMAIINANNIDINMGTLNILSYGATTAENSQLSTKVSISDMAFNGIGIDIDANNGVVAEFAGNTTIGSVNVENTSFGDVSSTQTVNTDVFNGLNNASIGNISMTNISIKNLNVSVKGL